ncbi:MAG: ATP-dependent DNA helicase RecQ [Planctomycetota bacterium]
MASVPTKSAPEIDELLTHQFGLDSFRPGQQAAIERLLDGQNVAAVFPTGGGKSLCYQLTSQLLPGTTVVVSPLIALMKDQCDALATRGIRAARLDSTLTDQEFRDAMNGIRDGSIKIVYVAPERFFNERFLAAVGNLRISLFAIDEAHCISQWGHNFRPDYLKLAELGRRLGVERVLALTATATPSVLDDICGAFEIDPENAIRTPFHRPNLHLRTLLVNEANQYETLLGYLQDRPRGATLIYVSRQKTAELIASKLGNDGLIAFAYHAGMPDEERSRIQQEFLSQPDTIIVATIAFGMGIDKPDIRFVYHYNPPQSIEAYAQEIGRAGRDGKDSICEMLLRPEDRIVLENFAYGDSPNRQGVGHLIDFCCGQPDEFFLSHYKLSFETDIRLLVVRTLLTYLELDGYVEATGPRYDTYKIHPLVTSRAILANFEGERKQFLSNLLGQLTKGRKWFTLNVTAASKAMDEPRERLVKAINFMETQGWIEVNVSDLMHGYRWKRPIAQPKVLADEYHTRLAEREAAQIARIDEVIAMATSQECQSRLLAEHFGETLSSDCGACSACRQETASIDPPESRPIGDAARRSLANACQQYPDHFTDVRQKARFLCGLSSPKLVRARLTRHDAFGVCEQIPYADVLQQLKMLT